MWGKLISTSENDFGEVNAFIDTVLSEIDLVDVQVCAWVGITMKYEIKLAN